MNQLQREWRPHAPVSQRRLLSHPSRGWIFGAIAVVALVVAALVFCIFPGSPTEQEIILAIS